MEIILETERLVLRELSVEDQEDLFELDSDPEVHRYIENNPVKSMDELLKVIKMLLHQYQENGIARWAVVDKETKECIGWCGLKYFKESLNNHTRFYELGYRFKQKHWGKGFATESSNAILKYAFKKLQIKSIYAITHPENVNSMHVLGKLGFKFIEIFDYEGDSTCWFELTKSDWENSHFPCQI
jgi:RimJ/RimL family protein N-acetyltransferase